MSKSFFLCSIAHGTLKEERRSNGCGVFVQEGPDHSLPSPDLFIEPFPGIGASKPDAVLLGKGQNVQRLVKPFLQTLHGLGSFFSEDSEDFVPDRPGFLHRLRAKQSGEGLGQSPSLGGRRMPRNIPKIVDLAPLPSDSLAMLPGGVLKPFVIIGDDPVHPRQSPMFEITKHVILGSFVFAVPQGQSRVLPLSPGGGSGGDQGGHRNHTLIFSLTRMTRASSNTNGFGPDSFRFFQAWTRAESPVDNWLTVDVENRVPHSSPVMFATFRVETPCTPPSPSSRGPEPVQSFGSV